METENPAITKIKEVSVVIKVTPEIHIKWKNTAKQKGMFFGEFLIRAIENQIKKEEFTKLLV